MCNIPQTQPTSRVQLSNIDLWNRGNGHDEDYAQHRFWHALNAYYLDNLDDIFLSAIVENGLDFHLRRRARCGTAICSLFHLYTSWTPEYWTLGRTSRVSEDLEHDIIYLPSELTDETSTSLSRNPIAIPPLLKPHIEAHAIHNDEWNHIGISYLLNLSHYNDVNCSNSASRDQLNIQVRNSP